MIYNVDRLPVIDIGRHGENEARTISINIKSILDLFPDAIVSLLVKRYKDKYPYRARTEISGDIVIWHITKEDTGVAGEGSLEIIATQDDVVVKSLVGKFRVSPSLSISGSDQYDPSDPLNTWLDEVTDLSHSAINAAESAKQYMEEAEISAKRAEMGMSNAGWVWIEGDDDGNLYYILSENYTGNLDFKDDGQGRLEVYYGD